MTTASQRVMVVDAESSVEANVDDSGYLEVSIKAGGGTGGTAMVDDAAFTAGSTSVTPMAGIYTTDQINSGDAGAVLIDADRHLQVDVLSGGGGGTQYADAAARGTATGTIAMGDDGTLIQSLKCDANGVLAIQDNGASLTVDGTFWQATQPISAASLPLPSGAATSANQLPDGHNVTVDNTSIAVTGTFYQATQPVSIAGTVGVDVSDEATRLLGVVYGSQGTQLQQKVTTSDLIVTLDGESVTVTGSVTGSVTANAGTNLNTSTLALETGGNLAACAASLTILDNAISGNEMQVDVLTMPTTSVAQSGVWDIGSITSILDTIVIEDGGGSISVDDGASSLTVDGTVVVSSAAGDIAHDSADSGSPLKVGAKAVLFNGSAPPEAAVAEGDRTNSISDEYGRQYVEITHPNYWSFSHDSTGAETNHSLKVAPGAGLSLYITDIVISNGATAGNITLLDGSGGSIVFEDYPAINGGVSHVYRTPIKLTSNTALCETSTDVGTHSINVCGFIAP